MAEVKIKLRHYKIKMLYLFNKTRLWARVPGARVTRPLYSLLHINSAADCVIRQCGAAADPASVLSLNLLECRHERDTSDGPRRIHTHKYCTISSSVRIHPLT